MKNLSTLFFILQEAISNPLTIAELLNPSQQKHSQMQREYNLGPLYVFREHFLVSHNEHVLYILDPRTLTAVAVVDELRRWLYNRHDYIQYFCKSFSCTTLRANHGIVVKQFVLKTRWLEGPCKIILLNGTYINIYNEHSIKNNLQIIN